MIAATLRFDHTSTPRSPEHAADEVGELHRQRLVKAHARDQLRLHLGGSAAQRDARGIARHHVDHAEQHGHRDDGESKAEPLRAVDQHGAAGPHTRSRRIQACQLRLNTRRSSSYASSSASIRKCRGSRACVGVGAYLPVAAAAPHRQWMKLSAERGSSLRIIDLARDLLELQADRIDPLHAGLERGVGHRVGCDVVAEGALEPAGPEHGARLRPRRALGRRNGRSAASSSGRGARTRLSRLPAVNTVTVATSGEGQAIGQ